MPLKTTTNWLFNGIWCYLVIGSFDWIFCVFQQTVVRVYYILIERKQRTKIHDSYSPYAHVACGVQRWSILGPLVFNINICDLFFQKYECDIGSYADDNTSHTYDSDLNTVLSKLKNCAKSLFTWFKENHMKPNGDKCQVPPPCYNWKISKYQHWRKQWDK